MKNKNPWQIYFFYIFAFFILNILNTYVLTIQELNRYIAPFRHTFLGEINAFLGNFSILFLVNTVFFIFIKKAKSRMFFLMMFTLLLNIFIYFMGVFNLFFGTAFSIPASTIFKNPAEGFASGTMIEALLELITYGRILVFLPFFTLLTVYFMSDRKELAVMYFRVTPKKVLSATLIVVITLFTSIFSYYQQFQATLPLNAVKSTFAIQHLGVYPYYAGEFLGQPFDLDLQGFLKLNTDEKIAEAYQAYNKNQSSYLNFFDGNTYSNRLNVTQAVSNLHVDESLYDGYSLHGILEGKNLVLVHLESINQFLLEMDQTNERLVFLNRLLEQSFVFNNFYNNVGMGVSSDGELSVLTGLYPMGDRTLYWEFENIPYVLDSIPNYMNQIGYYTEAIHGDNEKFYNRDQVYPDLFGFDNFYSLEDYVRDGYQVSQGYRFNQAENLYHHSPWISDYHLADTTISFGKALNSQSQPFMLFSIMMMPHTPFDYDPYGYREHMFPDFAGRIRRITMKYLNYVDYLDEVIMRFFLNENLEDQTLDNTVYIFYSDHGSGIKNGDLSILLNRDLSVIETRKILQQVPAWIYVPGENYVDYGDYQIREGLLKGEQNLVRSQVDLYRTMIELFNLPVQNDPYFGVHGLSVEPTFALDNRLMDVVFDSTFYSMRNRRHTVPHNTLIPNHYFDYILRFKQLSDIMISKGSMQQEIKEALNLVYGD